MLKKKIASVPVKVLSLLAAKIMGRNIGPASEPPPPPPPRRKPAAPPARPAAAPDHAHSHDHGGGHDHHHDHGGGHDHDHGGGHDHDHGHAAPAAPAPPEAPGAAPPAAEAPPAQPAAEGPRAESAAKPTKKKPSVSAEDTPNPNARKFVCSVTVVEQGSLSFGSAADAEAHPLGKALFAVPGVKSVFAVKDFVTVTKTDDADWAKLSPKLVKAIQGAL